MIFLVLATKVASVLESFPVLSDNNKLTVEDFSRFSTSYADILKKHLFSANQAVFAFTSGQMESCFRANNSLAQLLILFKQVKEGNITYGILLDHLMLSFDVKNGERVVAIVTGSDPLFLQKVSEDWLLEMKGTVEHEFLLLKQARVDSQTGLLNISNLNSLLATYGLTNGLHLILLALTPKRTSFQYFLRYSHKCASLLLDFVHAESMLHYLGQSIFALVLPQNYEGVRPEIERALVTYLKRQGCHSVQIGSSCTQASCKSENQRDQGKSLLDEAWTALRHAAKRGPFSFCDFALLAHPEKHPLALPDQKLVRRLNRLWAKSETFCLIQFCSDNANGSLVPINIDQGVVVSSGNDTFVYLDGAKPKEALEFAKDVIKRTGDHEQDIHISAGLSCYPYCDFKKSEMVFNCRKALLHAAFYGKSSVAVFDDISLNISGDIYFGDGDLAKAVIEYKRGLNCDNSNVNLHNSLGVALAMMNKLSPAMQSFKSGLALDNANFMALYNLGLGEQTRNRKDKALMYLKKALEHYTVDESGVEFVNDLTLQLGILSCQLGNYEETLSYLVPWQKQNQKAPNSGRVHYYLGEAYYGLKNNRKAMEELQLALRSDEMDDRAMNLLGRVYLEEGEGAGIALSLCRKSVELEPSNLRYKLHFAEVLLQCGAFHEARENLYRCLKNRDCKIEAQLLLGESFAAEGHHLRARQWFTKVLEQENSRQGLKDKAEMGLK